MTQRTSITWILPGIRATYSGSPRSYIAWLRCTAIGGWGLWSIWFRTALHLAEAGVMPTPSRIGGIMAELIRFWAGQA